jgi:hypothetical protein
MEAAVEESLVRTAQMGISGDGHADFKIGYELRAAKALGGNSHDSRWQAAY